jgi:hypothetical protein
MVWADRVTQQPVTAPTRFQATSLSKPVTAWGVLRLVEQGRTGGPSSRLQAEQAEHTSAGAAQGGEPHYSAGLWPLRPRATTIRNM